MSKWHLAASAESVEGSASGLHAFSSTRVPLNCSGAMYMGVPVSLVAFRYDLAGSLTREMPAQRAGVLVRS